MTSHEKEQIANLQQLGYGYRRIAAKLMLSVDTVKSFIAQTTGEFHFPNELAAQIAVRTFKEFMTTQTSVRKVIFNVFKDLDKAIYEKLLRAD